MTTNVTPWDITITADAGLSKPSRPFFEAEPHFHGSTCILSFPGFSGVIEPVYQRAKLRVHPAATLSDIHYFLRAVSALALFRQGNLLVHAAGVVAGAGALLFVGQSGAGKSTIAAHVGDRMVLHDDLICLRPHDGGWLVSALPGESNTMVSYPLSGVLLLAHAYHNYLAPVRPSIALAELIANSPIINAATVLLPQLIDFWRSLLTTSPPQRLHFRPDHSLWEVFDAHAG